MPLYCVTLFKPNRGISDKIKSTYEGSYYEINPTSFLIVDTKSSVDKMAVNLGLDGTAKFQDTQEKEPPHGSVFVLKKGFYQGFAPSNLWEWLDGQE